MGSMGLGEGRDGVLPKAFEEESHTNRAVPQQNNWEAVCGIDGRNGGWRPAEIIITVSIRLTDLGHVMM